MISYICGELSSIEADKAVIDVNGIGYGIFMPLRNLNNIGPTGTRVKIYTYLNVREDAILLYGFLNRDDLNVFKLILGVSGIGPKGALGILSNMTADDLRFAVASGDVKTISSSPGIGKKTAQKLILELNDKLKLEDAITNISSASDSSSSTVQDNSLINEAVEALKALGFTATEAYKAANQIPEDSYNDVESLIKQALKIIM